MAEVPKNQRGRRDPNHVSSVVMRMGHPYIDMLDDLCEVNDRSRREIVEILVEEAALELKEDPRARIFPL